MIRRAVGRHDLSTVEGQTAAVAAALPVLEGLSDPVRQSEYAHLLAELADVTEGSVVLALERRMAGKPVELEKAVKRASAQEKVEREMLRLLARDPEVYQELAPRLQDEHFQTAGNRKLFAALVGAQGDVGSIVASSEDDRLVGGVSALALEPLEGEPTADYARDVWARLQEFMLRRRSVQLRQRLQKLNPTTDVGYDALFQELIATDGELRRLRERGGVPA
jgi:DNA primase